MSQANYTHVQELFAGIEAMLVSGKRKEKVAERLGYRDKYAVKRLMKREKAKRAESETGIPIGPKGWSRKDSASGGIVAQQAYKIQRLKLRMKKSQLLVNLQEETEDSV